MKNFLLRSLREFSGAKVRNTFILVLFAFSGPIAYAQITSTTPASRCGEGSLTVHATATSGTITWFAVPFYGTPIGTGGSYTAENLLVTTTYYVDALDGEGCSLNPGNARVPVIATISANSIQAIIFYSSNTFCKSIEGEQAVTRTGTVGGVFSVDPAGLTLNTETGAITPSTSTVGTYTVTYAVVPQEGCIENPASTTVTITQAPEQPVISYSGSPYCTTHDPVTVVRTGATGGNYSASPSGLTINATSGTITPSSSYSGTYTVTYYVPGAGGCDPMNATTSITILQLPAASISYSSPFTKNQEAQPVTLTGTGVYEGGVFSSTEGLTINSATGAITPSTSDAGTYTVTYTLAAAVPCAEVITTTDISIYPLPTATISGSTDVCQNATEPVITFTGADGTPPYTFTYTLNDGLELNITTTSGSSVTLAHPTIIAGSYEYELIRVADATTSYQAQTGTATINVNELPVGLFEYTNSPFCSDGTDPLPTFLEGGAAGTFASTAGLVINASTGEIDLSGSTPGTYTVTNTIAAALGCGEVIATGPVTITQLPVATLEYTGSPYCTNETDPEPTGTGIGDGNFSSVPLGVQFVNTSTGVIDLSASTPGTYEIVNTIAAANGCEEVTATFISITIDSPTETPSINYSGSPYCSIITSEQPVELTGPAGGEYTSDPSGLSLNSSNGEIVPSSSTPGTYTVTYTVGGNGGCEPEIATAGVTIMESPAVTNSATKTICSSTSTDIHLTSSMDNTTFTWTIGEASLDIENASAGSGDHIDQILGNTNFNIPASVEYIITPHSEDNGCDGDPFTITVTVRPAVFLLVTDPPAVCSPNTVDLTASSVTAGSASGLTYTYWNDAATTSPLANPESVNVTGRYYIKATDANNCYDIKPVQTVVNPIPTATISGTTTVCQNDEAPLITFTGANATEPYTFTYMINGESDLTVTTTSGNSVTVEAPTNIAGTFTYSLVSVQDGSTTACHQTQTGSATITVDPTSVAGTINGSTTVCSGSNSTELSLTGQTGAVVKWQYSTDGFVSDINDIASTSITYTASDLTISTGYRVLVQSGVCPGTTSAPATITVIADPSWSNYSLPTPTSLCVGGEVNFSVEVTGGLGGTITWIRSETSLGAGTTVTTGDAPGVGTWYYRPHYAPTGAGCDLADGTETTVTVSADPSWSNYSLPTPTSLCVGGTVNFSIEVTGGQGGTITWIRSETSGGEGTIVETGDIPAAGTWYYRPHYAPTGEGCDLIDGTETEVTVNPIPDAPTGNPAQSFYVEDPHTVAQLTATGSNIQWYAASSGGTALETTTTLVTGTHYYASQTVNSCESSARFDVTVTLNPVKNTTLGTNYPTIQQAIDDPLTLDGHTIIVTNGTYDLVTPVNVTKEVTLSGNTTTPANVIINAPTSGGTEHSENSGFLILADNVTIQGFMIQGALHTGTAQNAGIYVDDPRYLTNPGLSNITITNNEITNNGYGIVVHNVRNSTISYNNVYGNKKVTGKESESGVGIVAFSREEGSSDHTYNLTIDHNTVCNNETEGIRVDASSDVAPAHWVNDLAITISNNEVCNNGSTIGGVDKYIGIKSAGWSKGVTLTGNDIYGHLGTTIAANSANAGIQIFASNDWEISGTNLIHNNLNGIFFGYSTFDPGSGNHSITGNEFYDNVRGISIDDGSEASAENNKIYDNNVSTFSGIGYTPYGIYNSSSNAFGASPNWWGHASGPAIATNPCGTGDNLSTYVTYEPWYTDAALLSLTGTIINTGLTVGGTGSICSGTGTNITVAASETGVSYQLRNDNANEPVGDAVAGTGSTINLPTGDLTTTTTFNVYATHATTGCSAELTETEIVTIIGCP